MLGNKEGEGSDLKLKNAIRLLERERRLVEKCPDIHLKDRTKRLRQACFKANYKNKRKIQMMESDFANSKGESCNRRDDRAIESVTRSGTADETAASYEEDDEELKSLLYDDDSFSSSNLLGVLN